MRRSDRVRLDPLARSTLFLSAELSGTFGAAFDRVINSERRALVNLHLCFKEFKGIGIPQDPSQ